LCLTGDGGRVDSLEPVAVVAYSYREALSLIAENERGGNQDDFLIDFEAYWRREITDELSVRTWLRSVAKSRAAAAWHGKQFYLIAENVDDCKTWMSNRYGSDANRTFKEAAVVWLDRLPEPEAYPNDASDARRLIAQHSPDGIFIFDSLMKSMSDHAVIVLTGPTANANIAQAALLIEDPSRKRSGPAPKPRANRGFRPGHTPSNILALRRSAQRAKVERVDAWLGRAREDEGKRLGDKRVVVIGCGSLGAGVAKLLLQSGVGLMTLVDPDSFAWANIGRHELGANSEGKNKATALAEHFRLMYPHARELRGEPSNWQTLLRHHPKTFQNCDLVLSLTGDWNAESALNDLQRSSSDDLNSAILYGWLEEQVGAAHALAIGNRGACLRCGFDPTGTLHIPATSWPRTGALACGAPTSIYGAIELAPAQALVASLAVDLLVGRALAPLRRTWLAPQVILEHGGGYWNQAWGENYEMPSRGGKLTATTWPEAGSCPCPH
jgi:molybdopterin/thiamine biosynthesis adenylyltransferase